VTVLEVIQRSTAFLAKKGVDTPRLQTELLLGHLLELPRMRLYLNFERVLTPAEIETFRELIRRRGQREPLQHITGSTSFCGFEIAVNRQVLVPRPETELLAEQGWKFLNQIWTKAQTASDGNSLRESHHAPSSATSVLDFGTGSGCLAIVLALKCPAAQVCAVDASAEALEMARQNAARHGVANRIQFERAYNLAALPETLQFDLIISNPPYIPSWEIDQLQPEVKDYEPRGALDGGPEGLDYFRRLADEAVPRLKPGGKIMVEFGDGQAERIQELFREQKWIVEQTAPDYTGRLRLLIAHG